MLSDNDPKPRPSASVIALCLRCRKCGREEEQTVSGVFDLLSRTWPQCCQEAMAMHLKVRWPEAPPGGGTSVGMV